jgi:hypothetical protein
MKHNDKIKEKEKGRTFFWEEIGPGCHLRDED